MIVPSNWDDELKRLREHIRAQLQESARKIVIQEIEKILGRVKIMTRTDLSENMQYEWFIDSNTESGSEK